MGNFRRNSRSDGSLWIYNPWLDLFVGCGAWSAPLLFLSYASFSTDAKIWAAVFYGLALFFNYPHYMATIYRAYCREEDFQKYRIFTVHITALVLSTLLLAHFWARVLPWIFTIYLTWSPWHYSGQNYGLFQMFARRAGANPDRRTRGALYGAFVVSYLVLFVSFHTGKSNDPLFLSLGIPAIVGRAEQVLFLVVFFGLSVYGLTRLARETGWRKLGPSLTLFSSQILWFLVPSAIWFMRGLQVPQNRYSTGVLAVMHSAQYLWITSYYAKREALQESGTERRDWRPLAYFGVLVVGGIALFVPGPWLASRAFHHDFTASFLIFTSLVNIHHFILDGAIWKLRDGRIAGLLLNSGERVSQAATGACQHIVGWMHWLAGRSRVARYVRVAAVVVLLAWGTVDQVRYDLSLHSDSLEDLQRAATLNSFDSRLQMRLARQQLAEGNMSLAEGSLQKAIKVNPGDQAARQELIRVLIDQKRFDEALQVTEAALKHTPRDPNLLVDRGVLLQQLGHSEQALANWNQALTVDSTQWLPHLYLAQELDREGESHAAAFHYQSFIDRVAHSNPQERPAPDLVIGIAMRWADCLARSRQPDLAIKSYQMAERLAAQTGKPKLESVAAMNEAELQAKSGKLDEALRLYQRALQLDESSGDREAGALDWLAYGQFLDRSGFPARLAYASVSKSEILEQALPASSVPVSSAATRKELEARLGENEADAIRRNLDRTLKEALTLRR